MRPTTACSRAAARRCTAAPPKSCAHEPERAAVEPEVVAHHFTEAGLDDLAIEWWGKAGDQALRRSAFQEAIAHLGKAIEMADKAGGAAAQGSDRRSCIEPPAGAAGAEHCDGVVSKAGACVRNPRCLR